MKTLLVRCAVCLYCGLSWANPADADVDPFVGTWKLARDECRYQPESRLPREMTIVMEPAGNGVFYRSHTVFADGHASEAQYSAAYDERPALVSGTAGFLVPVALKRIDETTVDAIYSRAFQVVAKSERVLDGPRNVMTITTTEYRAEMTATINIAVFHRQLTTTAPSRVIEQVRKSHDVR